MCRYVILLLFDTCNMSFFSNFIYFSICVLISYAYENIVQCFNHYSNKMMGEKYHIVGTVPKSNKNTTLSEQFQNLTKNTTLSEQFQNLIKNTTLSEQF